MAEDDLLLKLSLNSHLKSDKAIDPDLDHRFQALKSRRSKPNPNRSSSSSSVVLPNPPPVTGAFDGGDHEKPDFDDLFARFAALKGTLPSYSSSSITTTTANSSNQQRKSNDDDDDEDEVDKVIRWAIDAARLDPSPCSDDDDDDDDSHSDDDDDVDSPDGHGRKVRGKTRRAGTSGGDHYSKWKN